MSVIEVMQLTYCVMKRADEAQIGRVWAICAGLVVALLVAGGGHEAWAQMSTDAVDDRVRQHIERMAHERPPEAVQQRLQAYESYVQHFTDIPFLQAGVTVNANFVRALIAAESSARPEAVSSEGAVGLMQIMPATGRKAARELYETGRDFRYVDTSRLRNLQRGDLKDPAINILIGVYLLDRYNLEFGNNLAYTVGAWNAGPQKVRYYQGTPPYQETVQLIGRVNAYYLFFREAGYAG